MNPDPISDVVDFLLQPGWTTAIFWLLSLASVVIAIYAFSTIPGQRRAIYIGDWIFRFFIGAMWWQQTLWKLPPAYTDHPEQPFGETGLAFFEITLDHGHLVRDMGKAQDRLAASPGKRVETRRFHLNGKDVMGATAFDGSCGLTERRIGGPTSATMDRLCQSQTFAHHGFDQPLFGRREIRWRQIMVARAFIAQGAINQDKIGGWRLFQDLPG